jgi:type IV pilus assembly protein PilO
MKLKLSKKEKLILLAGILLVFLLIATAQFMMLSPLKSELVTKEQSLQTEQKLLDGIIQKKADETTKVVEDTRELQKKVPITPLQEQFILDLERAENVSNSLVKSMSFSKDVDVTITPPVEENPGANGEANTDESLEVKTVQEVEAEKEAQTANTITGLKKLTISLNVESPTYEDLEKFISTLESLSRIVVVESINYSGGKEITSLETEPAEEKLSYSLSVSAYYLPTLNDLIADLPKIDAPGPANKKNPLSAFSDVIKNN